jgi:hypothetical protein
MATSKFQQWLDAEAKAEAAERRITLLSLAFVRGQGPAVSAEEIEDARLIRMRSQALFFDAMTEMAELASQLAWIRVMGR